MKVNGKDYPIYEMDNKIHVWNHQPDSKMVHDVNACLRTCLNPLEMKGLTLFPGRSAEMGQITHWWGFYGD